MEKKAGIARRSSGVRVDTGEKGLNPACLHHGAAKDGRRRNPPDGFPKHRATQGRMQGQRSVEKEAQGELQKKPNAKSLLDGAKEKLSCFIWGGSSQQHH